MTLTSEWVYNRVNGPSKRVDCSSSGTRVEKGSGDVIAVECFFFFLVCLRAHNVIVGCESCGVGRQQPRSHVEGATCDCWSEIEPSMIACPLQTTSHFTPATSHRVLVPLNAYIQSS